MIGVTTSLDAAPVTSGLSTAALRPGADGFASALAVAGATGDREALRAAATELVASILIQPILSQLRESSILEGAFAPGLVEKQFAPLLDQHLANRIAGGANLPLVDVIVDRLAGTEPEQTS